MKRLRIIANSTLTSSVIADTNAASTPSPYVRVFNVLAFIKAPQLRDEGGRDFREALTVRSGLSAALQLTRS